MNKELISTAVVGAHDSRYFRSYEKRLIALAFVALSFFYQSVLTWLLFSRYPSTNPLADPSPKSSSGQDSTLWPSPKFPDPTSLEGSPNLEVDEDPFADFYKASYCDHQTRIYSEFPGYKEVSYIPDNSTLESSCSISSANMHPSQWLSSEFLEPISLTGSPDLEVDEDPFADLAKIYSDFPGSNEPSCVPDASRLESFYSMSSANLGSSQWSLSEFPDPASLVGFPDLELGEDPFADLTKTNSNFPGYNKSSYIPDTSTLEPFYSISSANLDSSQWSSSEFLDSSSLGGSPDLELDEDAFTETSRSQNSTPWIPEDINQIGYQDEDRNWRCKHSGCISNKVYTRACDLRKHFRAHQKTFFCNHLDCPQFAMGFSSSKDLQRHMKSHNPQIQCEEADCGRVFSRKGMLENFFPLP